MPEGAIYAVLKQVRTTTVAISTTSVQFLDADANRKGAVIFNDSARSLYLTFGPTASVTGPTKIIGPYAEWHLPGPAVWCGELSGIRESGSGSLVVTEEI